VNLKDNMKTITILGSTGSVGRQVLDVISKYPNDFKVVGLSAYSNESLLRAQVEKYKAQHYYYPTGAIEVQTSLFELFEDKNNKCVSSLEELAKLPSDIVVVAVTGLAGLWPSIAALQRGAILAIANKETLVCAGKYLKQLEKKFGGKIIPLDTEHSAIFNCLKGENPKHVSKLILTASGGALRDLPINELSKVTYQESLKHPVWSMGKKVTVDSATLFNKGLEIIEAMILFDVKPENIQVLMHRESIIHSLVEFIDGEQKAVLSVPDIALAIETGLFYPDHAKNAVKNLDLASIGQLNFSNPDYDRYPCLKIAMEAAKCGNGAIIAITSADEVLVNLFEQGKIKFTDIAIYLEKAFIKYKNKKDIDVNDIMFFDGEVKEYLYSLLKIK